MSDDTGIEWTDQTWNPSTGCSKVSEGCKFCYAETMAERLEAMDNPRYENGFEFTLHRDKIDEPQSWKKPRGVFVNSMSDLFHPDSPVDFLRDVFRVMMETPRHRPVFSRFCDSPEDGAAPVECVAGRRVTLEVWSALPDGREVRRRTAKF